MAEPTVVAAILAGGSGRRFWPLSSPEQPKQFLVVAGEESMIQATWRRLDGLVPPERRLVITAADHADEVRRHLPGLRPENLIGEPEQKDTAAASLLGAALAERRWPGSVVITLPADHRIEPDEEFRALLADAAHLAARENVLCTLGVRPTYPADCYGYIERGEPLDAGGGRRAFRVARFAEKPDSATAAGYLERGTFYWNAGIFIWPAALLMAEAAEHIGGHHAALCEAVGAWGSDAWEETFGRAYGAVRKISIDRGIMERTSRAAVIEVTFRWSDLGGWLAVGDLLPADEADNRRSGCTVLHQCRGNIVFNGEGENAKPVLCVGLTEMVVVHTPHGVLVCPKDRLEEIKPAVEAIYGNEACHPSR